MGGIMNVLRFIHLQKHHIALIHPWWDDAETRWLEEPTPEYVDYVAAEEGEHHFVVFDDSEPVALDGYGIEEDGAHLAITVRPGWRRKGYGSRILRELILQARAGGVGELAARVFPENDSSAALFLSIGFKKTGITADGTVEYRLSPD